VSANLQSATKLLITEVITNPTLTVIPIDQLVSLAHDHGCQLLIDNTFASAYCLKPLSLGADIVVHSATKYLSGHNDVSAGVIISNKATIHRTRAIVVTLGCNLGPFEAWLAHRGLKTFALRMNQHCRNALAVAQFFQHHEKVVEVFYPGIPNHPSHGTATRLLGDRFGGMVSFRVKDDILAIDRMIEALQLIRLAPSLAGVGSTLSHPLKTSHRAWTDEKQHRFGISMGLLRLSVGIEDVEDIIADLEVGLGML
jgi:cystathionine beta-lyase/cystathionine gamma-synthase